MLAQKQWSALQRFLLEQMFEEYTLAQKRRKQLSRCMAQEVATDRELLQLMRLMGIRHIVAFALGAVIGDISRYANPKKLVAYIGLTPSVDRSGKTIKGSAALAGPICALFWSRPPMPACAGKPTPFINGAGACFCAKIPRTWP